MFSVKERAGRCSRSVESGGLFIGKVMLKIGRLPIVRRAKVVLSSLKRSSVRPWVQYMAETLPTGCHKLLLHSRMFWGNSRLDEAWHGALRG